MSLAEHPRWPLLVRGKSCKFKLVPRRDVGDNPSDDALLVFNPTIHDNSLLPQEIGACMHLSCSDFPLSCFQNVVLSLVCFR